MEMTIEHRRVDEYMVIVFVDSNNRIDCALPAVVITERRLEQVTCPIERNSTRSKIGRYPMRKHNGVTYLPGECWA